MKLLIIRLVSEWHLIDRIRCWSGVVYLILHRKYLKLIWTQSALPFDLITYWFQGFVGVICVLFFAWSNSFLLCITNISTVRLTLKQTISIWVWLCIGLAVLPFISWCIRLLIIKGQIYGGLFASLPWGQKAILTWLIIYDRIIKYTMVKFKTGLQSSHINN